MLYKYEASLGYENQNGEYIWDLKSEFNTREEAATWASSTLSSNPTYDTYIIKRIEY